jgi:hypothetical protein
MTPTGKYLAAGGSEANEMRMFDVESGEVCASLPGPPVY